GYFLATLRVALGWIAAMASLSASRKGMALKQIPRTYLLVERTGAGSTIRSSGHTAGLKYFTKWH
ncbi:MAG TPA: hypothetical protein VFU37_00715, partial [Pyrinomonadaceae bacterium]|nr:hypothetical protein [Pyrinomonadaceae bacterium]